MLKYLLAPAFCFMFFGAFCQSQSMGSVRQSGCQNLSLDLETGTMNGVGPTAGMSMVKKQFPCFTGDSEEGGVFNCGGGVFFLKHDFYFYTGKDYIEAREKFAGTVTDDLLKKKRADVEKLYGKPQRTENMEGIWVYDKPYGSLLIMFDGDEVMTIAVYAVKAEDAEICY